MIDPSVSLEPLPSNATDGPTVAGLGEAENDAAGAASTVTWWVVVLLRPSSSVTVNETV